MSDRTNQNPLFPSGKTLYFSKDSDLEKICRFSHALSSPERVRIIQFLQHQNRSLTEISKAVNIPFSSLTRHIDILSEAGLIKIHYKPSRKGHAKYCSLELLRLQFVLEEEPSESDTIKEVMTEMPIGMFSQCHADPPCGMLSKEGPIGEFDDPGVLFSPERSNAECIWFSSGHITYNFPTFHLRNGDYSELSFSCELCSEAPHFNNKWLSDITFSVNGTELLTYTSPGDFGGKRGTFTPKFWPITSTQFGLLVTISITKQGTFLNNTLVNPNVTFDTLMLLEKNFLEFTLAVKKDAVHCGGINLFGANFGNYPQHIIMKIR